MTKLVFLRKPPRSAVVACLAMTLLTGCSKFDFDMSRNIPWGAGGDGVMQPPMKVVAVWTDTVLTQGMAPATRGFGGRVMFYAVEGGKPIKVSGTLTVYAFDETGRDIESTKPDRKFIFTPEQFEKHYSKSALGHSYSVWLPWDAAGGSLREISLMVRFQPTNGSTVVSDPSKQHLPGPREEELIPTANRAPAAAGAPVQAAAPSQPASGVQQVAYEQPLGAVPGVDGTAATMNGAPAGGTASSLAVPRRMTTTTIAIPNGPQSRRSTTWGQPSAEQQATPAAYGSTPTSGAHSAFPGGARRPEGSPSPAAQQQPAPQTSEQSSTHYGPQRLRPLGSPIARLERDHVPWQQPRLESPSAPPFAPQ
ncbi:MAG: hypothetical protein C0483_19510 [Pirellula sp.]|nr:hypothetical protein [Pirellula sp.]